MVAIDAPRWLPRESRKAVLTISGSLLLHAVALAWLPPPVRDVGHAPPPILEVRLVSESPAPVVSAASTPRPVAAMKQSAMRQPQAVPPQTVPAVPAGTPVTPGAPPSVSPPVLAQTAEANPAPHVAPNPEPVAVTPPDLRAAYLSNPPPPYPLAARRRGLEGRVTLRAEILENGSCSRISVSHSSGHELLDQAALQAVKQWHFVPAQRGGKAVAAWVEVPISFRLEDAGRG